ncbi:MAG: helix-hairpin-helix domain-containing protein [Ardenticatenaceae bacterium]|nr:helix-hairpin-helix domain-containing protein [Ardenticatenaceae bacterium]
MKFDRSHLAGMAITFFVGVILTAGGLTLSNRTRPAPIYIEPPKPTPQPEPTATPGPIQVYVNGQVATPNVYELPPGSRIGDAIEAAGGWTDEANTAVVNLALPLVDGMQIYVPSQAEVSDTAVPVVSDPAPLTRSSDGIEVTSSSGLVNINTANLDELDALPGIGPSTAQKILNYRDENGRFNTIEELMNVSGIGEAKFDGVKDLITVGDNP